MDGVANKYQGKARFATVDIGQEAGRELGKRYGLGDTQMAVVFFDRAGQPAEKAPTITDEEASAILDRLIAAN